MTVVLTLISHEGARGPESAGGRVASPGRAWRPVLACVPRGQLARGGFELKPRGTREFRQSSA